METSSDEDRSPKSRRRSAMPDERTRKSRPLAREPRGAVRARGLTTHVTYFLHLAVSSPCPRPCPLSSMSLGLPSSHVAPTAPRAKRTILIHEGAKDLDHERPEGDGLAEDLAVVLGIRDQVGVKAAGHAAGELHRRYRVDRFE